MVIYFTGTGNSRYCAKELSELLDDECIDSFGYIRSESAGMFSSERPWVFVCPTYAWQIPKVFADFIRRSRFDGNHDAYFVMTCGGEIGNAHPSNLTLCSEKSFRCRGTIPVVMPENYIAMFSAPDHSEALRIISAAQPQIRQAAEFVASGQDFPVQRTGALDKLKSGPINALFLRFNNRTKPFSVSDACTSCGKCERVCPVHCIDMRDGRPEWSGKCTQCMACICGCPVSAIEYGRASRGKPRYQCPEYESR